jgi:hypothetical protein
VISKVIGRGFDSFFPWFTQYETLYSSTILSNPDYRKRR